MNICKFKQINPASFRLIKFIFISLVILCGNINAQEIPKLSLGMNKQSNTNFTGITNSTSASGTPAIIYGAIFFALINPELVIENKKVYFGLTKELSIGKYPFGRLAFEYTYIFRDYSRNHLRFSYNYDFVIQTKGDFFAPIVSTGIGYFTDTEHKGVFVQGSAGIILPLPIGIVEGVYAYFKARHTFVKESENSDITDFSLGMSFLIYY